MNSTLTVDHKNFFDLLRMSETSDHDKEIIELIDNHLYKHFLDDDRLWFNRLCDHGLFNVILHCAKIIPNFSLYDHRYDPSHRSNMSFIRTIEGGNLDLIKYFMHDKDFPLFMKETDLNKNIGVMVQSYKERKKSFNSKNYDSLINFLAEKFPDSIEYIFNTASRKNHNDEITDILKQFLIKYKNNLTSFLLKNENDSLTIHCMLNVANDSHNFAKFLRKEFQKYPLDESRVQVLLYWTERDIKDFNWIVENPDFFKLENKHFDGLFAKIFQSPLKTKNKKEDYEYFNRVVKQGLHKVTKQEFTYSIQNNLSNLVKKHYKKFDLLEFKNLNCSPNTCTNFILKKITEKEYNELQDELPINKIKTKRNKM